LGIILTQGNTTMLITDEVEESNYGILGAGIRKVTVHSATSTKSKKGDPMIVIVVKEFEGTESCKTYITFVNSSPDSMKINQSFFTDFLFACNSFVPNTNFDLETVSQLVGKQIFVNCKHFEEEYQSKMFLKAEIKNWFNDKGKQRPGKDSFGKPSERKSAKEFHAEFEAKPELLEPKTREKKQTPPSASAFAKSSKYEDDDVPF
jgi:hypothetical protein